MEPGKEAADTEAPTVETADENNYPGGVKLLLVMVAISLNVFVVAMDQTIIATAIPHITDKFQSRDDIGWYASSYLLTTSVFVLIWGRCYTHFPIQPCLLISLVFFLAGSALCGAAPNSSSLIAGRAIAGIGAAGLLGGSGLVITHAVPLRFRGLFDSIVGGIFGVAAVVAPLIGGALTSRATWRWCFYINLPVGTVGLVITKLFIHFPPRHELATLKLKDKLKYLDVIGILTLSATMVCLLFALELGGNTYSWANARVIVLFVLAGVFLIAFLAYQVWKKDQALVPVRILRQRSIGFAFLYVLASSASTILSEYYLPIYFQTSKSASPLASGLMLLPTIISFVATSLVSGAAVSFIGYYTAFVIAGAAFHSVGNGLITTFSASTPESRWIGFQVILGIGAGMGAQASMLPAQTVLKSKDIALGLAVLNFASIVSGAIFSSVAESIYANTLTSGFRQAGIHAETDTTANGGLTSVAANLTGSTLVAAKEVYDHGVRNIFDLATALACVSIIGAVGVEWISVKKDEKESGEGEESSRT